MGSHRVHHYVARFHQSFFCKDGKLWVYDREEDCFRHLPPSDFGALKDYYAYRAPDGSKCREIEADLTQKIDSEAAGTIRRIKEGKKFELGDKDRLAVFAALQFVRVPEFELIFNELSNKAGKLSLQAAVPDEGTAKRLLEDFQRNTGETEAPEPASFLDFIHDETKYDLVFQREHSLETALRFLPRISGLFNAMRFSIVEAPDDTAFILTDNPLVIIPPKEPQPLPFGIGLLTPGSQKILPLTPRHCLLIGDPENETTITKARTTKKGARIINLSLIDHSTRFIMARERKHLEYLIKRSRIKGTKRDERVSVSQL